MEKLITLLILLLTNQAVAGDIHYDNQDRRVEGGDILYSGSATANNEPEAAFLAEATAIKALLSECLVPHKEIKIWEKNILKIGDRFRSRVVAGLSFEACDQAKNAKASDREKFVSEKIVRDQEVYDKYIRTKLGLEEKPFDLRAYVDGRFNNTDRKIDAIAEKLDSIDSKLSAGSQPQIIIVPQAAGSTVASAPKNSACDAQSETLMNMAYQASLKNFPPGNMAKGEAANYYNQAQAVKRNCQ